MSISRITRILVALLMAHFTFLSGDVSCASHGDRHGATAAADHHRGEQHAASTSSAVASTEQPCDTPTQPECCRAMTSCSVNALAGGAEHTESALLRERIESALVRAPRSPNTSPDPPPPRA